MTVNKNNKNILMIFRNNFLQIKTNNKETKVKLISKDNLIFKTANNNIFVLKESE